MSKPIEEMTGLELRAAIAAEVMGWKPPKHAATMEARRVAKLLHPNYDKDWYTGETLLSSLPHFEEHVEPAFQVVEKMRETVCMEMTCGEAGFVVEFTPYCGEGWGAVQNESLPLAICRAALQAVRSSNDPSQ